MPQRQSKNVRRILLKFIVPMFVLLALQNAFAQANAATIFGRVTDQQGALISDAEVEIRNIATNVLATSKTNRAGLYAFPNLQPGQYLMNIRKQGFQSLTATGITLEVQDNVSRNFVLRVGAVSESVTVLSTSAGVNTADASLGTVIDQKMVQELPLNGRSFQGLIQLSPGVVTTATDNNSEGQFSVNGQRTNANYYMVDGASANAGIVSVFSSGQTFAGALPAFSALGGTNSLVSTDAVQEFAIETSTYAPEFGRSPGAQISIVTRPGTNDLHGTAFDYLRNDFFDANDWFSNQNRLKRAALRQNDFGATLGGPLRRDKTFFFFSYEGLRLRQPQTGQSDVPTLAARSSASPSMQPFFNAYPLPTGGDEGNGLAPAVYSFSAPSNLNASSIRIDHHVSDSFSVFGRYSYSPSNTQVRGGGETLNTITRTLASLQAVTIGADYTITPRLSEDFRFNWTRSTGSSSFVTDTFGGGSPPPTSFPAPFTAANSEQEVLLSGASLNGILASGRNIANVQRQLNFVDNVAWQAGKHLIKTGVDYRRLTPQTSPTSYGQIAFFATINSAQAGVADALGEIIGEASVNATFNNYSLYIEDMWKPLERLNLTYGVRWDYNPAPTARGDNGLTPAVIQNAGNFPNLALAQNGTALYRATWDNFAPRLGIAYRVRGTGNDQTVLRTGAGIFYDLGAGQVGAAFGSTPFQAITDVTGQPFPFSAANAAPPPLTLTPPFARVFAFPAPLRTPYTYEYNLTLEQALGSSQTVTLSYVGALAHRLIRSEFLLGSEQGLSPDFQQVISVTNAGHSNYNAGQLQFRRRASKGLTIIASYALAHSLDNVSNDANLGNAARFVNPELDYGPSDFDIRHTGTVAIDYDLPKFSDNPWAKALFQGWSIDPVLTVRSAPPVDVLIVRDIGFGQTALRPDLVSGVPLYLHGPSFPGSSAINPAALTVASDRRQGDLGRNFFRGFPLFQTDIALRRRFRLSENLRLQMRVDAFNIFNHPNFAPENNLFAVVTGGNQIIPINGFGLSPSMLASGLNTIGAGTGFNPLYQIGGPRSLQLAAKFEF